MGEIVPFKNQDYESLLNSHSSNNLFEDPLFPCTDKSMYFTQKPPRGVVWKRPKQVRPRAKFVVNGFDRCDMDQGYIGNCWFIAGCVGIMQSPKLFSIVVPEDQSFDDNYAGIFHFRFWLYGQWVDVVIDDRLPFFTDGRLVFANNKQEPDEFWAPLLEKAYAKLYGSYESLEAGQTTDALIDMSGGLEESFDLNKMDRTEKAQLWSILFQGYKRNSIMGCSITPDPRQKEARLANGLVMGHAYTITKLVSFDLNNRTTQLIRIRNPWGNEVEWKGAWSDNSKEWNYVSSDIKDEIGLVKDADGEFWMSFADFVNNWHTVQICHLSADSFSDELSNAFENMSWRKMASDGEASWKTSIYHSEWARGKTAGGSGQGNMAKYWTNPQFLIRVNDVDLYDEENKATVIIALMQKDSRLKRINTKADSAEEFIQFRLYKIRDEGSIDESKSTGLKFYSNQLDRIGASGPYINSREVTKRFRLEPGYYLIIPSTYEEGKSCEFMLRILTEDAIEANTLDQDKDDLTEEESFFELEDTDSMFSSWDSFLKAAGQNVGEEEEDQEQASAARHQNANRSGAKEACSLM